MTLSEQLTDYVRAAFTGIWIVTHETDEAEREITQLARQQSWKLACWDLAQGLRLLGARRTPTPDTAASDPLAALRALPTLAEPEGTALLLLPNFHRFLGNVEVVQNTAAQLLAGKQHRTFVSPTGTTGPA